MKAIHVIAALAGLLLAHAMACAQTNNAWGNGGPSAVLDNSGGAMAPAAVNNYDLLWQGGYTLQPGWKVWNFNIVAYNAITGQQYAVNANWGNGSWSCKSVPVPGMNSYFLILKFYTQDPFGNIYLSAKVQSGTITLPP